MKQHQTALKNFEFARIYAAFFLQTFGMSVAALLSMDGSMALRGGD